AAGRDDAFGDLVAGGPGNVSVENGDVVRVHAQQLQRSVAVTGDVCRNRFQAQAVANRFRHITLVLDDQDTHAREDRSWGMSSAYPKPETCWQPPSALNRGMTHKGPARTTSHRTSLVAGLLVVIAATAAVGYQMQASSPLRAGPRSHLLPAQHR